MRSRTSALLCAIDDPTKGNLLIDIGPDFKMQALRESVTWDGPESIHALFVTHLHYDHIAGLDELRLFNLKQQRPFPLLISQTHREELMRRYSYIFDPSTRGKQEDFAQQNLAASIDLQTFAPQDYPQTVRFAGWDLTLYRYWQGKMEVSGLRVGSLAYITDIKQYDPSLIEALRGVEHLVLSVQGLETTSVQFGLEEGIAFAQAVGAKNTYFTHMGHQLARDQPLPEGLFLAYDGLRIPIR